MKVAFIILPLSALLFVSSSILSQTTATSEVSVAQNLASNSASSHRFEHMSENTSNNAGRTKLNTIVLAKVSTDTQTKNYSPSADLPDVLPTKQPSGHRFEVETTEPLSEIESIDTFSFSDEELANLRQLFLKAENALKTKDDAQYFLLADQLKEYPLYPYLQYQWLKKHLGHERQIKHFLNEHSSSRYAIKLKRQWLHYLAKHKQWSLFLEFFSPTKTAKLNCYFHLAQFNTGKKQTALNGAKKLWVVGRSQPRACDPLFAQLKKSRLFTQELRWQRFDAALQNNKVSLAKYIRTLMPQKYHAKAQLWLNLHRKPSRYMQTFLTQPISMQSPSMFRHAIDRLASRDIGNAIKTWDTNKQRYTLNNDQAEKPAMDKLERRLALKLVFEKDTAAYERLGQLDEQNNSSRTWRVRIALTEQNWPNVLTAIHALNDEEKVREKWQYWLARAYMETDNIEMAQALLNDLAAKRSFYGFLAADKVNSIYQLSDNPVNVTSDEITALKNSKEFHVAFELMTLDKKNEAKLQWWHAVRHLNKKEIITAAKLAQQWQWDEIAIFTIAKAKHWDDIEIRFPLSYADKVRINSAKQKLNPAILFGLIRRESAFNEKAHSPVGARGLMQIMPQTGRQIARHFNERWRGGNSLYNPATNLKYGSYYYQKLLNQFDGHYALALAAYNAGPERVKKWLPKSEALPADIWIETIPFHETRDYVSTVLAYALIYQQRTQTNELSMNDFTRDVQPRTANP